MNRIIASVMPVACNGLVPSEHLLSIIDIEKTKIAVKGEDIFALIINAVKEAKQQVLIETFVWDKNTPVIKDLQKALCYAGEKKIAEGDNSPLEVFVLVDELGRLGQFAYKKKKPHRWPHDSISMGLHELPPNVKVHIGVHHHASLDSTHAKIVLVDGETLIMTGANFQFSNYGPKANYDAAILIKGGASYSSFYDFQSMWKMRYNASEEDILPLPCKMVSVSIKPENQAPILFVSSKPRCPSPARVVNNLFCNIELPKDPVNNSFSSAIDNATSIIRIATPNLNAPYCIHALANFINDKNGILQLLLSKNFNDQREKFLGGTNEMAVNNLISLVNPDKRKQLDIRWYKSSEDNQYNEKPDVLHMKLMILDDSLTIFGSANLDVISLYNCHEANIVVDHPIFAKDTLTRLFAKEFAASLPLTIDTTNDTTLSLSVI